MNLFASLHGALAAACMLGASIAAAQAQGDFPTRPVRLVNPYTPGGSVDLVGRSLAAGLSEIWGHQVIVDNRPGAGTQIGSEIVVRAESDGYTMLINSTAIAILPSIYKKMRFDPGLDLAPVALAAVSPFAMVINAALPAKSVQELIALAKGQPGKIAAASSGVGTTNHLALEMFRSMANIDVLHVPYKGGAPATADLIAGQTKLHFNTPGTLFPHVKAGKLRALAITSARRADFAPQLPTVAKAGVPGYEAGVWYGAYGPKKTTAHVLRRWSEAINRYMQSPQAKSHYARSYMIGNPGTPEEFSGFHKREIERWGAAVKAARIDPQ
jgi:tripartite-type tricarboxylate transporter receptor subunit TctC